MATEYRQQFIRLFEKLRYRHTAMNIFSDFLAMSAISISNSVNFNDEHEQEYLRIIKNYNEDERNILADMFVSVVKAMQPAEGEKPNYSDVLGEMFESLQIADDWNAQFFTPQVVSDMTALMLAEGAIEKHGYFKVLEPCIGGGSMILGLINTMFQRGYNPCKQLLITAYDLDIRCVHMSYIQLSLAGVPAMIQKRNSLTNETYGEYWFTPVFVLDDWAGRLRCERMIEIMKNLFDGETEKTVPVKAVEKTKPIQLSLF